MDQNLLEQRLQHLQPEYAEFVRSDFLVEAAAALGRKIQLAEDRHTDLEYALRLYLLCFLSAQETIEFLVQNLDIQESIAQELMYAFQAALPPGFPAIQDATWQVLTHQRSSDSETTGGLDDDIKETEAALQNIPPAETPADPPPAERTYTSSQEALLREGRNRSESPPPANN